MRSISRATEINLGDTPQPGSDNRRCITPRVYRAERVEVREPRRRISPCTRDRCSSARSGGRLLLQLPRGSRTPRCHFVHLAAKLPFLSFSTCLRPDTKHRTSTNLPSRVSAANSLTRLHGALADIIFSRFDSLGPGQDALANGPHEDGAAYAGGVQAGRVGADL